MSDDDIRAGYTTVDGIRAFYEDAGTPGDPAVVFVHTAGCESLQWRHVLARMAGSGYRGLTVDLPGHGKSLPPADGYIDSLHDFGEFVWDFIRDRGLERPVVAGCSIGGDISLDMGVHHGGQLRGVVCLEGALRTPTYPESGLAMLDHASGSPAYADGIYHAARHCTGHRADPERVRENAWLHRKGIPEMIHADLTGWNNHDLRGQAERVTCPVLLVWGDEDYFVPEELVDETRRALPDCRYEKLTGIGHYPMLETEAFYDLMLEFLDDLGGT